jgi:hypothetical protein
MILEGKANKILNRYEGSTHQKLPAVYFFWHEILIYKCPPQVSETYHISQIVRFADRAA